MLFYFKACSMFLGEFFCLIVFHITVCANRRKPNSDESKIRRKFNPFLFLLPALCDMTATSTMYIGLNLTYASSFQMLRGKLVYFPFIL